MTRVSEVTRVGPYPVGSVALEEEEMPAMQTHTDDVGTQRGGSHVQATSCRRLDLGLVASRTEENTSLPFKPPVRWTLGHGSLGTLIRYLCDTMLRILARP